MRDAPEVKRITDYFRVSKDSGSETGFVEFPELTEYDYRRRIIGNRFFYVTGNGGPVLGFLAGYDDDFLRRLQPNDPISKQILEKPGHFVYVEQVADLPVGRGQGRHLFNHLLRDMKLQNCGRVFAGIPHNPITNMQSVRLSGKFGARCTEEIPVDGMVFGIYQIDL